MPIITTEQLIEELKKYPGHRVLVNGYEDHFTDPVEVTSGRYIRSARGKEWEGEYRKVPFGGFLAVTIERKLQDGYSRNQQHNI